MNTSKRKSKYLSLKVTPRELGLLVDAFDTLSSMIGGGDEDFNKNCELSVKAFDCVLKRQGMKRMFK